MNTILGKLLAYTQATDSEPSSSSLFTGGSTTISPPPSSCCDGDWTDSCDVLQNAVNKYDTVILESGVYCNKNYH